MLMQGLRENKVQFWLLVTANLFVGAVLGSERGIMGEVGLKWYGIESIVAISSFVMAFGISKAVANLLVGKLLQVFTRKKVLLLGWVLGFPVPLLLMYAPNWNWVIVANVLLGLNQGIAWSSTVIMKIDLVGTKNRGFAMGLNEFAGYLAIGVSAYLSMLLLHQTNSPFWSFLPSLLAVVLGITLSTVFIKDTQHHVTHEAQSSKIAYLRNVWIDTSWKHQNIGSTTINGFLNNLNDGAMWVLAPTILLQKLISSEETALVIALYPMVWGISQLFTGMIGDRYCKKQLITAGMLLQSAALLLFLSVNAFWLLLISAVLLGLGTALVYPSFLSTIAENTHPDQRAQVMSIFRFWRDSGYIAGAVMVALLIHFLSAGYTLFIIALLTGLGGVIAQLRMCCTMKVLWKSEIC